MSIQMIGIDYQKAGVDIRAKFAFTQKNTVEALQRLTARQDIHGAVILSTCNRMEMWLSTGEEFEESLLTVLCRLKGLQEEAYRSYFVSREGAEAVNHLFYLTCGLKSMILAEDQILSQVKNAIALSRETYCSDNVMEVLFRKAVTAAKKVKTEVVFTHASTTAVDQAVELLEREGVVLAGKRCMVIGNGEMGKLAAQELTRQGADVTVTVRQYKSGMVSIPVGCKRINYGERMELLPQCDLVISATSSPNHTIRRELFTEDISLTHPLYLVDLAVPRDIEPEVGELEQIVLYDIDDFTLADESENEAALTRAHAILGEEMEEFFAWYDCRDMIPRIQEIQEEAVTDFHLRIQKMIRKLPMNEESRQEFMEGLDSAAGKVVGKMMYGLRDHLGIQEFRGCLDGLEKLYDEAE
ncbi:MAG: glutamyl-tRNA reductase [Hespellia sp.]|nr:glutamyl-tRNA reductase [Hespellia sp.]